MFKNLAKTLCVVAALGAAGVAAPTAASAGDFRATISIGSGGVELVGHRGHRAHGRHIRRATCTPGKALRKARHFGIHRAHIRSVNRHSITVAGRKHRSHALVRFARVRGCPVIAYR
ncbi:hypothetical protein [Jiella pelagia]|uniref:Antifreeze protein n=1 Tax=Jiella pelagia TaxID=2986949 RepID=A0ABY7C0P9_9HYPH|nr:hypothetical protein [Jiella pelagia]WAP69242.1 hypothetical protein OH818_02735 [Jiella pelagia]